MDPELECPALRVRQAAGRAGWPAARGRPILAAPTGRRLGWLGGRPAGPRDRPRRGPVVGPLGMSGAMRVAHPSRSSSRSTRLTAWSWSRVASTPIAGRAQAMLDRRRRRHLGRGGPAAGARGTRRPPAHGGVGRLVLRWGDVAHSCPSTTRPGARVAHRRSGCRGRSSDGSPAMRSGPAGADMRWRRWRSVLALGISRAGDTPDSSDRRRPVRWRLFTRGRRDAHRRSGGAWICDAEGSELAADHALVRSPSALAIVRVVVDGVASRYAVFTNAQGMSFDLTVDRTVTISLTRGQWQMFSTDVPPPGPPRPLFVHARRPPGRPPGTPHRGDHGGCAQRSRRTPARGPDALPRTLGPMTTLRSTVDVAARQAIADRTEALFRRSGALRDGHFSLKSGRHSDAYLEKFAVLSDPAATASFAVLGGASPAARRTPEVDLVAGPTTGGVILAFETGRSSARGRSSRRRSRPTTARPTASSAGVHDRRGRTRPARRRHPHDGRLAARDDPRGRGAGRRDRRVRGHGRPFRRAPDIDLADDRPRYPLRSLWSLDLPTYEPGPATCPRCAEGEPVVKPGSSGTGVGAGS